MTDPVTADGAPRSAILFLHAQTSLHPGSGTALGVVDLPIQRERHTQWPLIPGTSLIASGMGLGPQRQRFHIRRVARMNPDGTPGRDETWGAEPEEPTRGWSLSDAVWPLPDPPATPCRLVFPVPLRLRRHGRLIEEPTLPDLIVAATRRIGAYVPAECRAAWKELSRESLQLARATPAGPWRGERLDLHRYSASQDVELDLHGVAGSLDLPRGPGELWPLLAAVQWLHLGKSTVMGLGQMRVEG